MGMGVSFSMLTYFQIYMEMCQHGKTNMSIYRISENCEKLAQFGSSFNNLAQEISI